MPNTITYIDNEVQIVFDGSTAWAPAQTYRVLSFEYIPASNANSIKVRDTSATGVTRFYQKAAAADAVADQRKGYEMNFGTGLNMIPYVVGTEVSVNDTLIMKYA
jgi:hypothetical protein